MRKLLSLLILILIMMMPLAVRVKCNYCVYDFDENTLGVFGWGEVIFNLDSFIKIGAYSLRVDYYLGTYESNGFQLSSGSDGEWGKGWNLTSYNAIRFYLAWEEGRNNILAIQLYDNYSNYADFWICINERFLPKQKTLYQIVIPFCDLVIRSGSKLNYENITLISFQFLRPRIGMSHWNPILNVWDPEDLNGTIWIDEVEFIDYVFPSWNIPSNWVIVAYPGWYNPWSLYSLLKNNETITHVNPSWLRFDFDKADGSIRETKLIDLEAFWIKQELIFWARQLRKPIIPLINNFDDLADMTLPNGTILKGAGDWNYTIVRDILSSNEKRSKLVNSLFDYVYSHGYQGVCIDFEGFGGDMIDEFNLFIQELYSLFNSHGLMVCIDVPPKTQDYDPNDWANWVNATFLQDYSDALFIICYDYTGFWGWKKYSPSRYECSIGPLWWIENVTNYYLSKVRTPQKIVIGYGVYGYDWGCKQICNLGNSYQYVAEILAKYPSIKIYYDIEDKTPRFQYLDYNGKYHTIHYEDYISWNYKLKLAIYKNVRGIRMWYLGIEQGAGHPYKAGIGGKNDMFWKQIAEYKRNRVVNLDLSDIIWVNDNPGFVDVYPCIDEFPIPIMLILGLIGLIMIVISPIYAIHQIKNNEYEKILYSLLFIIIGIGLVVGWLWG